MDAELAKLVEANKLTSKAAERLEQLKPGTFCLHKSWGFGRIAEWNLLLNQIVIDFSGKKGHSMQLQYAADKLEVIPPDHFLARKATDLDGTKKLAKEDPAATVKNILESLGGKGTPQQISEWMAGDLFTEAEWKRWWESTKKTLKKDGHFFVPSKKNEPVELRAAPVAQSDDPGPRPETNGGDGRDIKLFNERLGSCSRWLHRARAGCGAQSGIRP
jgi:transcription elongation factor GreA-like protein